MLKSKFNAENFTRRLSWSISRHFGKFILEMCAAAQNRGKFTTTPYFGGSRSFKVIDVDIPKKFDPLDPAAQNFVTKYYRLQAIIW